jgi:large-conductance mechanosensitive channel
MLSTSSLVEAEKLVTYDQSLMMIDLLNFMLLAFALIVLNPEDNLFNAKVPRIGAALSEAGFWALLGVYWLLLIHWTFRAKLFEGIGRPLLSLGVALGFIIQALAVTYWSEGAEVIQFIVIAYVLFYFGTRLLPSH